MKLIIQVPCLNEAETLPATLRELPRSLPQIETVEWLIVDDGSTDESVSVAKKHGVDHIVSLNYNKGLATAFMTGIDKALSLGADIIVNTDADNQYNAADIKLLIDPILAGEADYVVGARPVKDIAHFSPVKKLLQRLGSWTVRILSGIDVPDAPSGFRAISREAAYKLNVFNRYTYTLETLIQAGHSDIRTVSVPIRVNSETRPSRLFKSVTGYVYRSVTTILRFFVLYRAFPFLFALAVGLFGAGFAIGVRFLYLNFFLGETGHVQSVVLATLLMTIGFMTGLTAILADLVSVNRRLLEQIQQKLRRMEHHDHRSSGTVAR